MNKKSKKKKQSGDALRRNVLITILAIFFIAQMGFAQKRNEIIKNDYEVSYTQVIQDINDEKISSIIVDNDSSTAKITYDATKTDEKVNNETRIDKFFKSSIFSKFSNGESKIDEKAKLAIVAIPNMETFMNLLQDKVQAGNNIILSKTSGSSFGFGIKEIIGFLPTLIILSVVVAIGKKQGIFPGSSFFDTDTESNITFKDVAGLEEEKSELAEIIDFLKNPEKYKEMGAEVPKGVLLSGNPGTGKTLLAKAVAGEANVPFISMSGSDFIEMFVGLGASRVRKLFKEAKKMSPCILFIDEIDALGKRSEGSSGSTNEYNQTLNQLLVEMDGFSSDDSIILMAATNRPEMLDKALLRPGRFNRQITVNPPDVKGREEILKVHSENKRIDKELDLRKVAEDTSGFTGAELANVLNEAAIIATVKNHESINKDDVDDAIRKNTVGLQKTSRVISESEKKITAYHEAGHAVVSNCLDTVQDVKEISIIPRGNAGGYTMYKTNEDKSYHSKKEMNEKIISLLAGRAAEEIKFNDISTGASNDIEVATQIAEAMVKIYGMSTKLGLVCLKPRYTGEKPLGDNVEQLAGDEIKDIIAEAYKQAKEILQNNKTKLDDVANVLLKNETITSEEFTKIIEG